MIHQQPPGQKARERFCFRVVLAIVIAQWADAGVTAAYDAPSVGSLLRVLAVLVAAPFLIILAWRYTE